MTPQEWEKVTDLFHAASELEGDERAAFLDRACSERPALRAEVESLLGAHHKADSFISEPIVGAFASKILKDGQPAPGEMVGHYRILAKIGSGGMGEVFLAVDTRLGRQAAIKILSTLYDDDTSFVRRFKNEARAAAALNHPNVATIYGVEKYKGRPYIAMEYVEGKTLEKRIPDTGIDLRTFKKWFAPVIAAIAHAHANGIVHRDVKPGNIVIGDDDVPKVLDFGLVSFQPTAFNSRFSQIDITQDGQIIGTPAYMSPEQAEGREVDHRTDIFSLGVVMYEAATGKRPFTGDSNAETISNILKTEPTPVSEIRPSIPAPVAKLIEKCLRKQRSARPQSMQEVGTLLAKSLAASKASITSGSFARRLYRESRSGSVWPLAALALLVLVLSLAGWYFISRPGPPPPFSVDKISIRKLSQSNDVALSVISPDGRSVAYVTYEPDDGRSLLLRRVSDANAIRIVPSQQVHYWDIAFSNDSEYIYFITAPRFGTHGTLFRIPSLGGQPRKVADRVNHLGNLSPDGKRILFVRYGDPAPDTSVNVTDSKLISADSESGSDEQTIKVLVGESIIRKPRFSSDGRRIYYIKRELDGAEYWSIELLDVQTGSERQILRTNERIEAIAPLQSGNGILMNAVDGASNRRQLFHVGIPDGSTTRITNDLNSYIGVSVDRDGRNIVSVQRTDESRIWVGNSADFKSMAPLTREPLAHGIVDWTPEGGRIVFDVLENDRLSVWISDHDGGNAMQLTPQDSDNSNPQVSGDGRFIVFTSRRAGYNQIWRMNIDGSSQILLANVPGITQSPQFAADGKTVVFRWYNEGSPPMGQVSVDGGPVSGLDLPPAFTYYWAMSPDGKFVAYTVGGGPGEPMKVIVRPVDSLTPTAELNIRPTWFFKWTPDSKSIFYQESQQGEGLAAKVFQVDPEKREPSLMLTTEPDNIMDLTFSRDGSRFAAVRLRVLTDAVMLTATDPASTNRP